MSRKQKILIGVSIALFLGGICAYSEYGKCNSKKHQRRLRQILHAINQGFADCRLEKGEVKNQQLQLLKYIHDNEEKILFELDYTMKSLVNKNELIHVSEFSNSIRSANKQFEIFNIDLEKVYYDKKTLSAVNSYFKEIDYECMLQNEDWQISSKSLSLFLFTAFVIIIQGLEEFLYDTDNIKKQNSINFFFRLFLIHLTNILERSPQNGRILAQVLLSQVDRYRAKNSDYIFGHICQHYDNVIKDRTSNKECKCIILDLLTRYGCLIYASNQDDMVSLLIHHQVFQTYDQILLLTKILLKNTLYEKGKRYGLPLIPRICGFNRLLILGLIHPTIRIQVLQEQIQSYDNFIQYFIWIWKADRNQTVLLLRLLIQYYCLLFPLFDDPKSIQILIGDEKRTTTTLQPLFSLLTEIEAEVVIDCNSTIYENQIMNYFPETLHQFCLNEDICYLNIQIITKILNYQQTHFIIGGLCLQLLSTTVSEIQDHQKQLLMNAGLTKFLGFLILGMSDDSFISKQVLKKSLSKFPFQDKTSVVNLFTNVIQTLFDLPTMNSYILKLIASQCRQGSDSYLQSLKSHIQTSTNLSYDTYMITLQIGILFGNPDDILNELNVRMKRNLKQFELEVNFITRDLVFLIDIMENPYYALNILIEQTRAGSIKNIANDLHLSAAVSTMQYYNKLHHESVLEHLQQFINVRVVPQHVLDAFTSNNHTYSLKPEYKTQWPQIALQRDLDQLYIYLSKCPNKYNELMKSAVTFPFLKQLRYKLFKREKFINLFLECIKNENRTTIQVWLTKFLYYAKQHLIAGKKIQQVEKLFKEQAVLTFIEELAQEANTEEIVKYLRS